MQFLRYLYLLIYAKAHMPDLKTAFIRAGAWGINADKAPFHRFGGIQNALAVRKLAAKGDDAPDLNLFTHYAANL